MEKPIKTVSFISRTADSFTIKADGKILTLYKKDLSKKSENTNGGMWTKLEAAWLATRIGIPVVIKKE